METVASTDPLCPAEPAFGPGRGRYGEAVGKSSRKYPRIDKQCGHLALSGSEALGTDRGLKVEVEGMPSTTLCIV